MLQGVASVLKRFETEGSGRMHGGDYIFLNRKLLDWGWYKDINTKTVFIHCLLKANWKNGIFQGEQIPRGSFVTSNEKLAKETGLSVSKVRTAIKHLELTGEIASKGTSKFTVITVKKYDLYQKNDMVNDKQIASKSQTNDKQIATIEESKKEIREEDIYILSPRAPTISEVKSYFAENGLKGDAEAFFNHHKERGWKTSHGTDVTKDWKKRAKDWKSIPTVQNQTPLKTRFHNFEQHSYDFEELEKKLFINERGGT